MKFKMVEIFKYAKVPVVLNTKPGERALILSDYSTDPEVWQAIAAACNDNGVEPIVSLILTRDPGALEPPEVIAEMMKQVDVNFIVTSNHIGHTAAIKNAVSSRKKCIMMETTTCDVLTGPAARADYFKMQVMGSKIKKIFSEGKTIKVTTELGTNLTASIEGRKSWNFSGMAHPEDGQYLSPFPDGEVPIFPVEGTGQGVIFFDVSVAYPQVLLKTPIKVVVENGVAVSITGCPEADKFREYLEKNGDDNSFNCPAEIAIGINPNAIPRGGLREDRKLFGTVHVGLGSNTLIDGKTKSKTHMDGVMTKPTVWVDYKMIVDKGNILV